MSSKMIIRFQDCDPLNHLNNAKYFDYYFNAREDHVFQAYKLTSADFFKKFKAGWVAYNHNISYLRPALVGENVVIHSSIIFHNENTMVVELYMTDLENKILKNHLWTTMKYIDVKTGLSMSHHPEVMDLLGKVTLEDVNFDQIDKNERMKQIKADLLKNSEIK